MIRPVRAYLIVPAALRHLLLGLNAVLFPTMFVNQRFIPLVSLLPLWVWAAITFLIGALCLVGGIGGYYRLARVALIASAVSAFVVGGGILIGASVLALHNADIVIRSAAPLVGILTLALAAADYIVLSLRWTPDPAEPPAPPERP